MTIGSNEFRRMLGHFPTGVTVVTSVDDEGAVGMAIGSFSSVSLDPPLVMFCPAKTSSTWRRIARSGRFCVNILGDDQKDVCGVFAGKDPDKFSGIAWHPASTGSPRIEGSIGWIDCEINAVHDGGDHDIVVGLVKDLGAESDRGPLLFFKGGYGRFEGLDR